MARKKKLETPEVEAAETPTPATPEPPREKSMAEQVAEAVKMALKESLPLAVAAGIQAAQQAAKPAKYEDRRGDRCGSCGQAVYGCQGKHKMVPVHPSNLRNFRFFPGIILNGVKYRSSRPGEKVLVPEAVCVEAYTQPWEDNEEVMRNGRIADHHSGVISGKNGAVNVEDYVPAIAAWR